MRTSGAEALRLQDGGLNRNADNQVPARFRISTIFPTRFKNVQSFFEDGSAAMRGRFCRILAQRARRTGGRRS